MQHDQIIVSLPFIEKNWLRQNRIKYKKVGFNFTNLMLFVFREQNNLKDSKELETLVEKNGQQWLINESLYCAAVAYCQGEKIAENFTKDTLIRAIILADQQTQQKIMKCWELSQTFGASFKKKAQKVTNRTK
jgi:hypothetical protein